MLKKVVYIARHGPRNPIRPLHRLDQSIWENLKTKDEDHIAERTTLTLKGRKYCKEFGNKIKEQYGEILNLDHTNVKFYSSKISRTQDSAILVAESLCNLNLTKDQLNFHCAISADPYARFGLNEKKFRKLVTEIMIDNPNIDRLQLMHEIRTHLGDIETNNHFFDINGTLECYHFEEVELPQSVTSKMLEQIEECAKEYYKKLASDPLMHFLGTDAHSFALEELHKNDGINLVYASTHDTIVFPLSQHINKSHTKLPKFCSHIKYELYDDGHVDIYYDDALIEQIQKNTK